MLPTQVRQPEGGQVEPVAFCAHSQEMISPVYATDTHRPDLNRALGEWVHLRIFGEPGSFSPHSSMGVFDGETLIGATVFHNWVPSSGVIELTSAADDRRWLHPRVIRAMFGFCFDELPCQLAVLRVSDRNETMISIARRFGFEMTHIPRLRGRNEGEWICTMTEDAWRQHQVYKRGLKS